MTEILTSSARITAFRCALLLFVALVLAVSFAVPAKDLSETPYDESAPTPYVSTRVVSLVVPESVMRGSVILSAVPECVPEATEVRSHAPWLRVGSRRRPDAQLLGGRTGWTFRAYDSLTILVHSLRC